MPRRTKGTATAIQRWVLRQLPDASAAIVLQTDGLTESHQVASWPGSERDRPEELGSAVLEAAQDDCDGRGSATSYRVSWMTDNGDTQVSSYPLRLTPNEDSLHAYEEASIDGLVKQLMRHNEVMMRQMVQAQQHVAEQVTGLLRVMGSRLDSLEAERATTLEMQAEAQRQALEVEATEEDRERARSREERLFRYAEMWFMRQLGPGANSGKPEVIKGGKA